MAAMSWADRFRNDSRSRHIEFRRKSTIVTQNSLSASKKAKENVNADWTRCAITINGAEAMCGPDMAT
jgi:hypothetical protein